jgi:hypothetical protein
MEKRTLSAPGRADDRDHLAFPDFQRRAAKNVQ